MLIIAKHEIPHREDLEEDFKYQEFLEKKIISDSLYKITEYMYEKDLVSIKTKLKPSYSNISGVVQEIEIKTFSFKPEKIEEIIKKLHRIEIYLFSKISKYDLEAIEMRDYLWEILNKLQDG